MSKVLRGKAGLDVMSTPLLLRRVLAHRFVVMNRLVLLANLQSLTQSSEPIQIINRELGNVSGEPEETCANPGSEKRLVYSGSGINSGKSERPCIPHPSV